jgi:two-component system response regulator AtoC
MAGSVLLIDDDVDVLRSIGKHLEQQGYEVTRELNGDAGLATCERLRPDVVILNLQLPGMNGMEVLEQLREQDTLVVLMTDTGDVPAAVQAIVAGAECLLTKPVALEHLAATVARTADKSRLRRVNRVISSQGAPINGLDSLGTSSLMKDLVHQIGLLAHSERTTVLLQGEAGTGKGWVARLIHDMSPRSKAPFVEVVCGSVSPANLDSLLFGHERGAFDGARDRQQGLFEIVDEGTIFIEDIADLPPELQPKLLKFLETRSFRRLGGTRDVTVDVRLIAGTSRDIKAEADSDRMREDLYYRLSVMPLDLPPVRERPQEDLLALITRLHDTLRSELSGAPPVIAPEALERLQSYVWPGNIREIRNVLERAMILAQGQEAILVEHLPGEFRARYGMGDRRHTAQTLDDLERQHIERTLRHHSGNRTRSAAELEISRATLINKIKRYSLKL